MRSVGKISSASLSVSDTRMPEFVNRIYVPWFAWVVGGKKTRRTFQGASGVMILFKFRSFRIIICYLFRSFSTYLFGSIR